MKPHHPEMIQAALGASLRKFRLDSGLSQLELSARADLHFTYLSDTERGQRNIGIVNVVRLAEALDVPLDTFFLEVQRQLRLADRSSSKRD